MGHEGGYVGRQCRGGADEEAPVGLGRVGLGAASPRLYERVCEFSDYFCERPPRKCPLRVGNLPPIRAEGEAQLNHVLYVSPRGRKRRQGNKGGRGTKAIMASPLQGFAVWHLFSERSPCVALVNGERIPAVREPIPSSAAGCRYMARFERES